MQSIRDFVTEHKIWSTLIALPVLLLLVVYWHARGPYHSYRADLAKPAPGAVVTPDVLKVGVAKSNVTPDLSRYDKFIDKDGDNKYKPEKGDTFEDTNGNGKLDAVWMAGFGNDRPAQGVHDPLWARAIAFENNGVRVVMVTVDSIGIFHDAVVEMRKRLSPSAGIDHLVVSSLHDHEAPDTMGIWSIGDQSPYFRYDHVYREFLIQSVVDAAEEAASRLEPADAILAQVALGPKGFVDDSRDPQVLDNTARCARFVKHGTDTTIGTMVVWGNHPETLGGSNPLLTSDFSHYLREGVENGVTDPNGAPGFGGMCLYFQGMVGGLMTQLHTTVPHRDGTREFKEDNFDKAQALGENVALGVLGALRGDKAWKAAKQDVAVVAKSIFVTPQPFYRFVLALGIIHPGWYGLGQAKTEVDALRIGDMEVLTIPGELYPEIAEGGIEAPAGQDYPIAPVEVPPLRGEMQGKLNCIVGLANDEVGYIIPKSQWDTKPPYAYGRTDKPQYGEENSFGPEVAGGVHKGAMKVLEQLHQMVEKP